MTEITKKEIKPEKQAKTPNWDALAQETHEEILRTRKLKIELAYDKEKDVLTLQFGAKPIKKRRDERRPNVIMKYDSEDNLVGYEIRDFVKTCTASRAHEIYVFLDKEESPSNRITLYYNQAADHLDIDLGIVDIETAIDDPDSPWIVRYYNPEGKIIGYMIFGFSYLTEEGPIQVAFDL